MVKRNVSELKEHEFNKIFGNLPEEEFESLRNDIKDRGIITEVQITEENVIVCGHQRIRACRELGIEEVNVKVLEGWTEEQIKEHLIKDNILRRQLTPFQIVEAGKELKTIYEGRAGIRLDSSYGQVSVSEGKIGESRDLVAKDFGISGRTFDRYEKTYDELIEKGKGELIEAEKKQEITLKQINKINLNEELEKVREKLTKPRENIKYEIIYADPPWDYNKKIGASVASEQYLTLKIDQVKSYLEDNTIETEENAILFLWVTFPLLEEGLETIKAWGFKYKTCGFNWIKTDKEGKPCWGIGHYTKSNSELCLLATKGDGLPILSNNISQIILSERREHSRKPEEIREKIVELVGNRKRIELFARQKTEGWDVWGNEV